jgi:hypothetical protein
VYSIHATPVTQYERGGWGAGEAAELVYLAWDRQCQRDPQHVVAGPEAAREDLWGGRRKRGGERDWLLLQLWSVVAVEAEMQV